MSTNSNDKLVLSDSSSTCSTCETSSEELLNTIKLNVVLTKKGLQIYGTWSKDKLLKLLTHRLIQPSTLKNVTPNTLKEGRLQLTVNSGLYSVRVLKGLQDKGMSLHNIVKAMKLGLMNLNHSDLLYFRDFKIEPHIFEFRNMWKKRFHDELIENLRTTGLNEIECWDIIIYGVMIQSPFILRHLVLCGIDIPGILKWQSPIKPALPNLTNFLKHIGIQEKHIELVKLYGIDEETEQMLVDLGLNRMEEKSSIMKEIICQCSLTILESICSQLKIAQTICSKCSSPKASSNCSEAMEHFGLCSCQCHISAQNKSESEINFLRKDYLRQNIMVPVSWALARTLRYKPTDPLHYTAYQLLRWVHDNVSKVDKDYFHHILAMSTTLLDRKLIMQKQLEKEEQIKIQNREAMQNIPCDICKDHQELSRIKKQYWKYIEGPLNKIGSCQFPYACSSCKLSASNKSNDLMLSDYGIDSK